MNPLIKESVRRRWHRWMCEKFGHIDTGPYYGMPQAHCRRCGKKTWSAGPHCKDWVEPWGEYE